MEEVVEGEEEEEGEERGKITVASDLTLKFGVERQEYVPESMSESKEASEGEEEVDEDEVGDCEEDGG